MERSREIHPGNSPVSFRGPTLWALALFGVLFWVLMAAVDLLTGEATSFLASLFAPGGHRLWLRLWGAAPFLAFGTWALVARGRLAKTETSTAGVMQELQTLLQAIDQSPSIIVITDAAGNIEFVNPRFCQTTGYSPEEVRGLNPRVVKSGEVKPEVYAEMWSTVSSGQIWRGELCNRRKDGELFWEAATVAPVLDPKGRIAHYLKLSEDVSDRKEAQAAIRHMLFYDRLTGLASRDLFFDRVEIALRQARRRGETLAVLFVDLDKFQKVIHSLGHGHGDELLCQVADRLTRALRASDTVARLGSDIFTVLLPQIAQPADAGQVARKLLDSVQAPFTCQGHEVYMTASIGVALWPQDGEGAGDLLRNADAALARAKREGGGGCQFYDPSMNARALERVVMENHLRRALDRQEFLLYYQPQIDLGSGELFGAEALIRWKHPERGLVAPDQFIPLAEETGLIVPIGEWVVPAGCSQLAAWRLAGAHPLRLAVNLSARQFHRTDLVPKIRDFLAQSDLAPDTLSIEITENAIMQDLDAASRNLQALKDLGVHLAIDDFGTGHASLVYLKRFPIDLVKIDRSFIAGVDRDPNDAAIVSAVIAMAHQLGVEVLAEGVERPGQLEFLRRHSCDKIQGFLLSPPVPADEFAVRRGQYGARLN